MDFISKQIQDTLTESRRYFERSEASLNECCLLTLSSLLKLLHVGVGIPDFFVGCEDDIIAVLDSLRNPLWKRSYELEKLWNNPVWVYLCEMCIGISNALPKVKSVTAFDIMDYENDNLPFIGEGSKWTIFSKALLDVCYKSNNGECLSLLFKELAKGERVSIGILYRCVDNDLGNELGRNLKDEFLSNCKDMISIDLQELVFLPLTVKKSCGTSFDDAMSILATMK